MTDLPDMSSIIEQAQQLQSQLLGAQEDESFEGVVPEQAHGTSPQRPSCRSRGRKRTPQSGAVRMRRVTATVSPAFPIMSPSVPMSWARKSENGWKLVPLGTPLGAGLGVVKTRRVWQFAQPIES